MNKRRSNLSRILAIKITLLAFFSFLISCSLIFLMMIFFQHISKKQNNYDPLTLILFCLISSATVGTILAFIFLRIYMKRVDQIKEVLEGVSAGDFTKRIDVPKKGHSMYSEAIEYFNKMLDELNSNAILKADFVSNFSHEFKTPIVSIKGYAELIYETPDLDIELRNKYLNIIIEESRRLAKLASQTLLMSKLDSSTMVSNVSVFNLDEQIRECVLLLDNDLRKKNIDVVIDLEKIALKTNKDLLKEVWINLINNAINYSKKEAGRIDISSYQDLENIIISIRDNGIGIEEEIIPHIFDKYYQADSAHKSKGIGLGLSISQRIIEIIGGKITVSSVKGQGSVFNVILPVEIKG